MPKKTSPRPTDKPRIEYVELGALRRWPKNPKAHDMGFMGEAFNENGFVEPIVIDEGTGRMVAGHGRLDKLEAMKKAGQPPPDRIDVIDGKWLVPVIRGMKLRKPAKHVVASNRGVELGGWNASLASFLNAIGKDDLVGTGYGPEDLVMFAAAGGGVSGAGRLAEQFVVPPFSVLDARQGYWQDRKAAWLSLGIQSEIGRGDGISTAPAGKIGGNRPIVRGGKIVHEPLIRRANASPGGSPRPAMKLAGGKTVRGDGAGKPLKKATVADAQG